MSGVDDPFRLGRFVEAQESIYSVSLAELRAGRKRSHWMWFVFPQLAGLGISQTALFYGLAGLPEAKAYLDQPVLGRRLREATEAVLSTEGRTLHAIFGSPDDLKFCSSMTLFELATKGSEQIFSVALDRFCDGERDERTLALLAEVA